MKAARSRFPVAAAIILLVASSSVADDARPSKAKAIEQVGRLLGDGRFEEAESTARALLESVAAAPESMDFAEALDLLVTTLSRAGKAMAPETETLARKALSIKEKARGPDSRAAAVSATNLAVALRESGDYGEARSLFERARAVFEKSPRPDDPSLLACLNDFAGLLWVAGDLAEARTLFERVLAARETSAGRDELAIARALNNLAMVIVDLGDAAAALPVEKRALEIWERKLPAGHLSLATGANNLAWIFHSLGDTAAARPLYERALAIREAALPADHPHLAWTKENLALALEESGAPGDLDRALSLHLSAFEARKRSLGPMHPHVARSLHHIAIARRRRGDLPGALDAALEAEMIGRDHLRWMAREMAERQALRYREARDHASVKSSGIDIALSIVPAVAEPKAVGRTWDSLVRSRTLVLDETAARRRAAASSDPGVAARAEQLRAAAERLANVMVRGPRDDAPAAYRRAVEASQNNLDAAERSLAEVSASFRERHDAERLGLTEVAAALDDGSALVAFARSTLDANDGSYVAFVLAGKAKDPCAVALGSAREIDGLVARWGEEAARGALRRAAEKSDAEAACRAAGLELRRKVWDPVAGKLGGARRVLIVTDGALHFVSFAALPVEDGKYLVETAPVLQHLTAERDLVPRSARTSGAGILAVGGPDFGPAPAGGDASSAMRFDPLAASAEEAKEVAALFTGSAGEKSAATILTGDAATEAAFKRLAPGRSALHIATHGFVLDGESETFASGLRGISRLKKRESAPPAADTPGRPPVRDDPFVLSGLAFAGANEFAAAGSDREDGILTAEEIAVMDLSTVELAVLSACDTGVGRVQPGEGVLGLRRAFQSAGVRAMILSLWQVEDKSAREWMRAFYQARFVNRRDTAEAARDASLAVLRDRRDRHAGTHPFFWAGFVPVGR